MDSLSLQIEYAWEPLVTAGGEPYRFPEPVSESVRQRHAGPAVYRWVLAEEGQPTRIHVGETDDLPRRLYGYLNPAGGQGTDQRVRQALVDASLAPEAPRLELLKLAFLEMNGKRYGPEDLRKAYVRRALERILTMEAFQRGDAPLGGGRPADPRSLLRF